MPMLIFGVIFRFNKNKSYQGFGNVLVGLGFVFLGIGYMKEGFETMKEGLDLAQYAMEGYLGIMVYVLLGAIATVVIQSSSATVALIITALATGQITYINGLELAIGANIGTTVTAVLGALTSNSNGKRLAVAHFIFNIITGIIAIVFLYQLAELVDMLAASFGIGDDDYAMKLALFHTIFNILGVVVVSPFTHKLVKFLQGLFKEKDEDEAKAKYLNAQVIQVPQSALESIRKEIEHLYDNSTEILTHALSLHRHNIWSGEDLDEVVKASDAKIDIDIDKYYEKKIKDLYGDIVYYATLSQEGMDEESVRQVYYYKVACKDIAESIKDAKDIQKNINHYMKSENEFIRQEYNFLRKHIALILNRIHNIRNNEDELESLTKVEFLKEEISELDMIKNGHIDKLIRENKITTKMATSLINDSSFVYDISKRLIEVATTLWIQDPQLRKLTGDMK